MQPLHARLLIGPQRASQGRTRIDAGAVRCTQCLQGVRQPRSGRHVRPVGRRGIGRVRASIAGAGQHPHRLGETSGPPRAASSSAAWNCSHRAFQPLAIDLDPLAAQQHQAVGAGEQRR